MPGPTPFKMLDVVNGVLTELRYAPGRDVQIHLQDGIVKTASRVYRTLMQKYIWRDFYIGMSFTTDPATGYPVQDVTNAIKRFSDLKAVFIKTQERALPFVPALVNPFIIKRPTVVRAVPPYMFSILPVGTSYNCVLFAQSAIDTDFNIDDTVPFYKDMLVLATAYDLALKAGTNNELTGQLKKSSDELIREYRVDEIKPQYTARPINTPNVMTDWYVTNP